MPEFQCVSPVCHSKLSARTEHELSAKIEEHVRTEHQIPVVPQSILSYLEHNAVTRDGAAEPAK
jgi:predicted small metal-binding protein